jgi:hypothetical protein
MEQGASRGTVARPGEVGALGWREDGEKWCEEKGEGELPFIEQSSGHVSQLQQVAVVAERLWVACFGILLLE